MYNFNQILGKYFNPDEILYEVQLICGPDNFNGEILLGIVARKLCEKIERLENEIKELKGSKNGFPESSY